MADHSKIEWTDATWNPITGCSVVSPGCANCYAMKLAGGRLRHHPSRGGLTTPSKAGPVWNGQVRLNADWLSQPLQWARPRRIFVCAHGDLFAEAVPDAWIDKVFAAMFLSPQHTFQVLTKRPERMRAYLTGPEQLLDLVGSMGWFGDGTPRVVAPLTWPLPNVWLGVSAEDQARAEERIPFLLATPATKRFLSAEPLLGPIKLQQLMITPLVWRNALTGRRMVSTGGAFEVDNTLPGLDWVIAGGESGPGARPMHPDWARRIRDDCAAAGVPFFFKQWGEWGPRDEWRPQQRPLMIAIDAKGQHCPDDVAPQDIGAQRFAAVGKKAAGRLLDGRTHDAMPPIGGAEV